MTAETLKAAALAQGFALAGIARAEPADGFDRFTAWLDAGYAGSMTYLHKNRDARRHPESILPDVKSVLMLAWDYLPTPTSSPPASTAGRVARYAADTDYHTRLWAKLNALAALLPDHRTRGIVDTAPLLERDFAQRAGLGWIGKNTMLISPKRGSFLLLAALLTDAEFPADAPFAFNRCGSCTACLDACPTQAFPAPGTLDATRCISYLTIEHRGPMPLEFRAQVGDWLFGCDVCQDVCPWNAKPLRAAGPTELIDVRELLTLSETDYRQRFKPRSISRTKRSGLIRNAAIVLGNVGSREDVPALEALLRCESDETVRDAARWALERLEPVIDLSVVPCSS